MRSLIVDFLVNLTRPSQLQANPFLRGFYFSGVRAVMVDDVAAQASRDAVLGEDEAESGATKMFNPAQQLRRGQIEAPAAVARSRKIPQWVFLSHLFNDVILKDRVALSASGFSSRVSLVRRLALAAVIAICLVCRPALRFLSWGTAPCKRISPTRWVKLRRLRSPPDNLPR